MPAPKGHKQYGGFVKGFDPKRNMKGRPKLGQSIAERIRAAMDEPIREDGYTKFDALIDEAMSRAKAGNFYFFQALLQRAYGNVPDKLEIDTQEKPDLSKLTDQEIATLTALLEKAKR